MTCNKISYDTKKAALNDIKIIKAGTRRKMCKGQGGKENRKMTAYECPRCKKWHLTTISRNVSKRIEKKKRSSGFVGLHGMR